MKILHTVESFFPEKNGMSEVVRIISESLVKQGHNITIATRFNKQRINDVYNGIKIISFEITGSEVLGYNGDILKYQNFIVESKFDIIVNFAAQQWATDLCLPLLERLTSKKIFVPTGFSALYDKKYFDYYQNMQNYMRNYDLNIFLSYKYRDFYFAVNNNINNYIVIPNGASYLEFSNSINFNVKTYLKINTNDKLIIHVGSYTGEKGHQEAIKIFLKSKINNYSLLFIGDNFENNSDFLSNFNWFKYNNHKSFFKFSSLKSLKTYYNYLFSKNKNKIYYCSLNRQELVATYLQSDILLFPSKIECSPLVVFEAMASKTICLASDVGNVKEIFESSGCGIVLPTKIKKNGYSYVNINKSSKILLQIANQSNLNMVEKGYNFWKNNNTWESISLKYEQIYKNLFNKI